MNRRVKIKIRNNWVFLVISLLMVLENEEEPYFFYLGMNCDCPCPLIKGVLNISCHFLWLNETMRFNLMGYCSKKKLCLRRVKAIKDLIVEGLKI